MLEDLQSALQGTNPRPLRREVMVVSTRAGELIKPMIRGLLSLPYQEQLQFGCDCVARCLEAEGHPLTPLRVARGIAAQVKLKVTSAHGYRRTQVDELTGHSAKATACLRQALLGVPRDLARDLTAREEVVFAIFEALDHAAEAANSEHGPDPVAEHAWQAARLAKALRGELPPPAVYYHPQESFYEGERIRHPVFGDGWVVEVRFKKVDVDFCGTQRTLIHATSA